MWQALVLVLAVEVQPALPIPVTPRSVGKVRVFLVPPRQLLPPTQLAGLAEDQAGLVEPNLGVDGGTSPDLGELVGESSGISALLRGVQNPTLRIRALGGESSMLACI